jgi:hypothetical protein
VTERKLEELVCDDLLRPRTSRDLPEWRVPPTNHREPAPPEGHVVSFVAFHERAILHYYGVELYHLTPNSVSQVTVFAAVCEGYLGVEPHRKLWLYLFKAEHFT